MGIGNGWFTNMITPMVIRADWNNRFLGFNILKSSQNSSRKLALLDKYYALRSG
jgi:hypothetical protein